MTQTQTQTQHHSLTRTDLIHQLDQEVDRLLQARHLLAETLPATVQKMPIPHAIAFTSGSSAGATVTAIPSWEFERTRLATVAKKLKTRAKRKMSPAARRRISEAQKARWKKFHQAQKKSA